MPGRAGAGLPCSPATARCARAVLAGLLFGFEFVFIFVGVDLTTVSRMVVFLYTAPCFTVLGLHFFVAGERMGWRQGAGVLLAFGGLVTAFIDKAAGGSLLGDFFGVLAALFWAATTVLIRATALARVTATKVLLYQLVVSATIMFPLSWLVGERGIGVLSAPTLWAMAYQVVVVAFISYLAWFWLLTRFLAGSLAGLLLPDAVVRRRLRHDPDGRPAQPAFLLRRGDGGRRHRAGQSAGTKMNDLSPVPFSTKRGDCGSLRLQGLGGTALGRPGGSP